jgi:amino-acid N-acetyltransferase
LNKNLVGVIGVEIKEQCGLLRSLAVDHRFRKAGYGARLVTTLEDYSLTQKLEKLFLLTTTAVKFFEPLGYCTIARELVPREIQETTEFSAICPRSAAVMMKNL